MLVFRSLFSEEPMSKRKRRAWAIPGELTPNTVRHLVSQGNLEPGVEVREIAIPRPPADTLSPASRNGRLRHIRGMRAEALAIQSLESNYNHWPHWLFKARASTNGEDRNQIDLVLETKGGQLWLQIKVSEEKALKFNRARRHPPVNGTPGMIAIAVNPEQDQKKIYTKIIDELARLLKEAGPL